MPRKLRLEFPGAMYHVMSRGDQREDIFLCDVDRYDFLKTLAETCRKIGKGVGTKYYLQWLTLPLVWIGSDRSWLASSECNIRVRFTM